jgi:hypothetical protein
MVATGKGIIYATESQALDAALDAKLCERLSGG